MPQQGNRLLSTYGTRNKAANTNGYPYKVNPIVYLDYRIDVKYVNELLAELNHLQVETVRICGKTSRKSNSFTIEYVKLPKSISIDQDRYFNHWINTPSKLN